MSETFKILAINPGSTSTKVAVFENDKKIYSETIEHSADELKAIKEVQSQLPFRIEAVLSSLDRGNVKPEDIQLFVGRGGGLLPVPGGVYEVDDLLLDHASKGVPGQHPAQLGSQISAHLAKKVGGKAYIVNPPDTDEFHDVARVTGLKDVFRLSSSHALNQKEIALRYCQANSLNYKKINLIICHIGGGISVTAHRNGSMIDSNNILGGDGPMAPTRAGTIPALQLVRMCFSGKYTEKEMTVMLTKEGGLVSHLGTADVREIEKRISDGDEYASLIYNALIYQIGKDVGAQACVLGGKVKAIILTGGISNSKKLVTELKKRISWIAEVVVMPGEFEMEALASGALRVNTGKEKAKKYTGKSNWTDFEHLKKKGGGAVGS